MNRPASVSLKDLLSAVACATLLIVVGFMVYGVFPVTVDVTCDPGKCGYQAKLSAGDLVDIQGRNKNGAFETLARNLKIVSYSEVKNRRNTQFKLVLKSSVNKKRLFQNYAILRVYGERTEFIERAVGCKSCGAPTPVQ